MYFMLSITDLIKLAFDSTHLQFKQSSTRSYKRSQYTMHNLPFVQIGSLTMDFLQSGHCAIPPVENGPFMTHS